AGGLRGSAPRRCRGGARAQAERNVRAQAGAGAETFLVVGIPAHVPLAGRRTLIGASRHPSMGSAASPESIIPSLGLWILGSLAAHTTRLWPIWANLSANLG